MKKTFALIICGLFCICSTRQLCAQQTNTTPEQFENTKAKAEKGDAEAQCHLGNCYRIGQGVETNYIEAVNWYR
jgi:TPR repeat protein